MSRRLNTSPIRFIALDLDGTLLQTDKSISTRTRSAVLAAEALGYLPIIATARPPRSAAALLDGFLPDAPRIYYSGARILIGDNCIFNCTIPCPSALEIVNTFMDRAPRATVSVEIDDRFFATHPQQTNETKQDQLAPGKSRWYGCCVGYFVLLMNLDLDGIQFAR